MGLFLTKTELQELTGYKIATKQSAWLQARGYYTEINARGIPRITYTQVEDMRRSATKSNNVIPLNQSDNSTFVSEPNYNNLRIKIKKVSAHGQA